VAGRDDPNAHGCFCTQSDHVGWTLEVSPEVNEDFTIALKCVFAFQDEESSDLRESNVLAGRVEQMSDKAVSEALVPHTPPRTKAVAAARSVRRCRKEIAEGSRVDGRAPEPENMQRVEAWYFSQVRE
jgi:hypothetical protein